MIEHYFIQHNCMLNLEKNIQSTCIKVALNFMEVTSYNYLELTTIKSIVAKGFVWLVGYWMSVQTCTITNRICIFRHVVLHRNFRTF